MLENIESRENVRSLARQKARDYNTKTVHPKLVDETLAQGWTIDRRNKQSVRLRKEKPHGTLLEDRVWSLLYRMTFAHLSGNGGATLSLNPKEEDTPKTQIDVVGIDDEVAVAIECKSAEKLSKRAQFQEELAKHSVLRDRLSQALRTQFPIASKRQLVLAMFLSNVSLSDNDVARAKDANVLLFDERDLAYYENLTSHLGPAAKYQLLAEMLPGKMVPGLEIKVPAVKTKMGGTHCYTFSISPEYLLKISYVSHRSKGKPSDVNTYQRMLRKSRLDTIRDYISDDGIFPTNIVITIEKQRLQFDRIQQDAADQENGVLGWLTIRPTYKCAWIIDGQHRLYAYSGHERATKARLSVLAFEGLPPSEQARLFIDINAEQRRVKQSLLQELDAELHWDAEDPSDRVRAIISKAVQILDSDPESPLYQRIQKAHDVKDDSRCISLTSVYGAVQKTGFHIVKEKKGFVLEYGPLWAGENEPTLRRTVYIIKNWLNVIRDSASDWWDKGSGDGGGLAMNDGVITCVNVLRSVFQHLDSEGRKLVHLDAEDLCELLKPYAEALGNYFASFSEEGRKRFRDLGRGIQGQTTRTRRCQQAIQASLPSFSPSGLAEFLEQEKAQTNIKARGIIVRMEQTLQKVVLDELRQECGPDEKEWWMTGVPVEVRKKVAERHEEDGGKRGGKENYFDLIDYKKIALQNWKVFEPLLAYGETGNKEKRLSWLDFVNEKRNIVFHPSSAVILSIEDLVELQERDRWLSEQVGSTRAPANGEN